jgi:ribA/ribD-fused uncharacterized protein
MAHTFPQDAIRFYTTKDEFGFMSNFARYKVECFGQVWMTSEHAYQAQKFSGTDEEGYKAIVNAPNPGAAAGIGRDTNRKMRPEWNSVRDDVMRFVVLHKFNQNPKIREKLLATGERALYEFDTHRGDQYWAIDQNGFGKNMLGLILMEVREVLREEDIFQADHAENVRKCTDCTHEGKECANHSKPTSPIGIYLLSLRF